MSGEGNALRIRSIVAVASAVAVALIAPAGAAAQGDETTTVVACTPSSILVGSATSCSATVQDVSSDGPTTPTGTLEFSSDTPGGEFENPESGNPATTCTVSTVGENGASCRLLYVPGTFGTGIHKVTASYGGDVVHDTSSGPTNVNVSRHPTATTMSCAPGSLTIGAGASTCTVTVIDTSPSASAPTGGVALSSPAGSFGPGCESLVLASTSQASCTAAYTPSLPGVSSLTGTYAGDSSHETSGSTAQVSVAGAAATNPAKRKCKKAKKKRAAPAAKKKCKKRKRA